MLNPFHLFAQASVATNNLSSTPSTASASLPSSMANGLMQGNQTFPRYASRHSNDIQASDSKSTFPGLGGPGALLSHHAHAMQLSPNSLLLSKKQSRPTFTGHQVRGSTRTTTTKTLFRFSCWKRSLNRPSILQEVIELNWHKN